MYNKLLAIMHSASSPATVKKVQQLQSYAIWCDRTRFAQESPSTPIDLLTEAQEIDIRTHKYGRTSFIKEQISNIFYSQAEEHSYEFYTLNKSAHKLQCTTLSKWIKKHRQQRQKWLSINAALGRMRIVLACRQLRPRPNVLALMTRHPNFSYYTAYIAFIEINEHTYQVVAAIDTLSQINMVSPRFMESIETNWNFVSQPSEVQGAGGQTSSTKGEIILDKVSMVYKGKTAPLQCTVLHIPEQIDLVLGIPEIKRLRLVPIVHDYRCYSLKNKETIRLDDLKSVLRRRHSAPWNVLSLCGGIEPQITSLLELGYPIGAHYSIELSEKARNASSVHFPGIIHLQPHDMRQYHQTNAVQNLRDVPIHAIFAGFSGLPVNTHDETTLHTMGSEIINQIEQWNPTICKYIDNSVPYGKHQQMNITRLNALFGSKMQIHNAANSGSPATRIRAYWVQPPCDFTRFPIIRHIDPGILLEDDFNVQRNPVHTITQSTKNRTNDRNYAIPSDDATQPRDFTPEECERFNPGTASGITNGYGTLQHNDDVRRVGTGNAFNCDELWQVLRQWPATPKQPMPKALATAFDMLVAQTEALELFYLQMDDTELWKHLKKRSEDESLTMPLLHLTKHDNESIPYQTKAPGIPPPRLSSSADYCVDSLCRDGSHMEVEYSCEWWICLLFFKEKGDRTVIAEWDGPDGTYKKGDELSAMRPLKDKRWVNAATWFPGHWAEHSPDRHTLTDDMPVGTCKYIPYDAHDAYHKALLHEDSRKFCVSTYTSSRRKRYIMAKGGSQGLAPMGTFFPAWMEYGFNFFFGPHHRAWIRQFIDDCFAFGPTDARVIGRYRLMSYALALMGLTRSEKTGHILPRSHLESVGLYWTPDGICLPPDTVTFICELLKIPPKGITEARRLRGVVLQAIGAFAINLQDKQHFNRLMANLGNTITEAEQSESKRIKWTDENTQAMIDLSNCLRNQPLVYHDPSWVLSDDRCLAQIGDADPDAIAGYLVSVARSDARDITIEDLHDPTMTVIIAFHPKILNSTQRRWHILDKEIFVHIHLHRKVHKFVNKCITPYALREPAIPKLLYVGDNKSALRIRMGMHIPGAKCEYLTAKYQRAIGWSEETAWTLHWPTCSLDMPGESNNLADLSCRYASMFKDRLINPLDVPTAPEEEDCEPVLKAFELTEKLPMASTLGVYYEMPCPTSTTTSLNVTAYEEDTITSDLCSVLTNMQCYTEPTTMPTTRTGKQSTKPSDTSTTIDETLSTIEEPTTTQSESYFGTCIDQPQGFTMHIHPLTAAQWTEMSNGYSKDKAEFNSIQIADILSVATGTFHGSNVVSKKVRAWMGTVFFLLHIKTGSRSSVPILFTPAASIRPSLNIGVDFTTHLVMVIPTGSKVRLSCRTSSESYYDEAHEAWAQQNTTCSDILWHCHDRTTPHASQAATISAVKRMAWWPNLEIEVKTYIKWCTICSASALRIAPVGLGSRCKYPLLCWQIDDKIITDPNIVKLTGFVSVLVMYETTLGLTILACRKTAEAWEVAHIMHTRVVQYYGLPLQILSDHAPCYVKQVATTLCAIQGIQSRITCSKGSHCKGAEQAIRAVSKVLETASAKGDLKSATHLELYIANLQIQTCQLNESDGATAFERMYGFKAITTTDILQVPALTECELLKIVSQTKNATNAEYLKAMHERAKDLIEYRSEMTDTRAKWQWTDRLGKSANRGPLKIDYASDDDVSVDGEKWTVQKIKRMPNGTPENTLVTNNKGQFKWVRADKVLPLSVPVQQCHMPVPPTLSVGTTIFYYDSESPNKTRILCGDIRTIDSQTFTVQVRQPNETARTWLPRWTNPKKPASMNRANYGKQKADMQEFHDTTTFGDIICTAELTDGSMLDIETVYYLQSKGVDINIAKTPTLDGGD